MGTLNFDTLEHYSYDELKEFMNQLNVELCAREAAAREQAIDTFKRAYEDLRALGIIPSYSESWADAPVELTEWGGFYFNP